MPHLPYLKRLNPEQRRAVVHGVSGRGANIAGPLLVIAGAGTGKTSVLAHRVAHLIVNGADPGRLLLLTFTRRAAAEMRHRVAAIAQTALAESGRAQRVRLPWCGTFHAVGLRLLREYAASIGIAPNFTIHDRGDSADLMNLARHQLGLAAPKRAFPSKELCLAIYSRAINARESLETVLELPPFRAARDHAAALSRLFAAYKTAKHDQRVVDFDDLLRLWLRLLLKPEMARTVGGRFDHVLVDEYQDTNVLQSCILSRLKPDGAGVTVVGDDAQSIYSFRAAEIRNILDFPAQFEPPATVVTLEQNYRSTQPILSASNAIMRLAREGFQKALRTERRRGDAPLLVSVEDPHEQAGFVVDRLQAHLDRGGRLRQVAVLYRDSHHSIMLESELVRRDIPYRKFGGAKFLEAAHIKDVLAVLGWAENPADQVRGMRVLQLLPGWGAATAGKLVKKLDRRRPVAALTAFEAPPGSAGAWRGLVKLMKRLDRGSVGWPHEIDQVVDWYRPYCERHHDDSDARLGDLEQLQAIARKFKTRRQLLADLTLDPHSVAIGASERSSTDDLLTLSTIHSAKGQEWKSVYLLNVIDGCLPSSKARADADLDEERRLLYVAMTRAKDQLIMMVPRQTALPFGRRDDRQTAQRSQFLPRSLLCHFEPVAWSSEANATLMPRPESLRDLSPRAHARWREVVDPMPIDWCRSSAER